MQEKRNSFANALELRLSCTNSSIFLIRCALFIIHRPAYFLLTLLSEFQPFLHWLVKQFPHICRPTAEQIHIKLCGYPHYETLSTLTHTPTPFGKRFNPWSGTRIHWCLVSMYLYRDWRMCQRSLSKFGHLHRLCRRIQLCMHGWVWRHRLWDR